MAVTDRQPMSSTSLVSLSSLIDEIASVKEV
jgi:hypothetical protein